MQISFQINKRTRRALNYACINDAHLYYNTRHSVVNFGIAVRAEHCY